MRWFPARLVAAVCGFDELDLTLSRRQAWSACQSLDRRKDDGNLAIDAHAHGDADAVPIAVGAGRIGPTAVLLVSSLLATSALAGSNSIWNAAVCKFQVTYCAGEYLINNANGVPTYQYGYYYTIPAGMASLGTYGLNTMDDTHSSEAALPAPPNQSDLLGEMNPQVLSEWITPCGAGTVITFVSCNAVCTAVGFGNTKIVSSGWPTQTETCSGPATDCNFSGMTWGPPTPGGPYEAQWGGSLSLSPAR